MNLPMVAPLAGAWIEIRLSGAIRTPISVAPLAGAWIEIIVTEPLTLTPSVAPLAGAWIEILNSAAGGQTSGGRSPRGSVD